MTKRGTKNMHEDYKKSIGEKIEVIDNKKYLELIDKYISYFYRRIENNK